VCECVCDRETVSVLGLEVSDLAGPLAFEVCEAEEPDSKVREEHGSEEREDTLEGSHALVRHDRRLHLPPTTYLTCCTKLVQLSI